VYNIINESINHSSQFISVKVKKNLRKSQAQFREKVKKIEAQAKLWFSYKKTCIELSIIEAQLFRLIAHMSGC